MTTHTNAAEPHPHTEAAAPAQTQALATPPETVATSANDNAHDVALVEAARPQMPPPEAALEHAPEAMMPPANTKLPTPEHSTGEAEHQHEIHLNDNQVAELNDKPFALETAAEKKIASYLHDHLSPILSKGLLVDVRSNLNAWPTGNAPQLMDLHIDIMGNDVHNKSEELWARATEELKKHPAFEGLEIGGGYETTGHKGEPITREILENTNKLHMVVAGIPIAHFRQLLETTAEVKPVVIVPAHAHQAAEVAAQAQASAAAAIAGHPPATEVASIDHQGVANDNALAPNQPAVGR